MERLKVLLFISPKVDAQPVNHELTTSLALTLKDEADVDLRTSWNGMDADALRSYHIIHIFGCWNLPSAHLMTKAHRLHIPTVYSPLGGLQPWIIRKHRSSYDYTLQRQVIQKASAIHVCSNLESEKFARLGWNPRSILIKNPILTSLITFEEMGKAMLRLYRKVLDTQARLLLDEHSRQAIGHLLELGVDKDVLFDHQHCQAMKENLALLTDADWRRVMIYAADEHIVTILRKGLERIQFVAPEVVIEQIDRFPELQQYAEGDLKSNELCYQHPSTMARLDANLKELEVNERKLCIELLNLKHEITRHQAPLLHLANIYSTIRFLDMDEDRIKEIAREMGLADFAERLMAVLRDVMRLSEGFMPFHLKDDKGYKELSQNITKFNTWN
ncbi:MAG: hypothetical protein I3J02_08375 [Prevotella sp.]|nr:hypothetical protein [Prevotella sp.]